MRPNSTQQHENTLTVHQVASRLNVSARTVWGWIAEGKLAAIKMGKRTTRVRESSVSDFIRACEGGE